MARLPAGRYQEENVPDFPPIEEPMNPNNAPDVIIVEQGVIKEIPGVSDRAWRP
jgi:hypothetical protein